MLLEKTFPTHLEVGYCATFIAVINRYWYLCTNILPDRGRRRISLLASRKCCSGHIAAVNSVAGDGNAHAPSNKSSVIRNSDLIASALDGTFPRLRLWFHPRTSRILVIKPRSRDNAYMFLTSDAVVGCL